MPDLVAQMKAELADREVIRDCIFRVSRAIDRCDEKLFWSVYWPEAVHTGMGSTVSIDKFIPFATAYLRTLDQVVHMVGNLLIKVNGSAAAAETYFYSYHRLIENGKKRDNVQGGRYLDRLERREGDWRIIERIVVVDWFREYPDSADWEQGTFGIKPKRGLFPDDKSYALFDSIS